MTTQTSDQGRHFIDPDKLIDTAALPPPAPCPFCGNAGESPIWICGFPFEDGTGRVRYEVQCVRCHASGPMEMHPLAAARRWNSRAPGAQSRDEFAAQVFAKYLTPDGHLVN